MKKYICPFCGKELNRNGIHHIYKCKENKEIKNKDEIRLTYLKFNFGEDIDKKIVEDYSNLYSLPMLKERYEIDYKSITFLLKLNGIEIRNISESAKKISINKYKKTCIEKYGVENVSQLKEIKGKKGKTFTEHYGVDNIWKLSSYNKMCAELHPESHEEHMKKVHKGRDEYFKNITEEGMAERIAKTFSTQVKNGFYNSKLELRICKALEELNISYTRQFHLKGYKHPYDFHLCDTKIIIEVNGDFWHANPLIYEENDIVKLPETRRKAKEIWERDKKHIDKANSMGYKVISIWEYDIKKLNEKELIDYVIKTLNDLDIA